MSTGIRARIKATGICVLLIAFQPFSSAKVCAVVYDPQAFQYVTADWSTILEFIRDPSCDKMLLFPPVLSFGSVKARGILQILDLGAPGARAAILKKAQATKLQLDIIATRFSPEYLAELKSTLATENIKVDKWIWSFHGTPANLWYGASYDHSMMDINSLGIEGMKKDQISFDEFLSWSNGNLELTRKLFKDKDKIFNPCAEFARKKWPPVRDALNTKLQALLKRADELEKVRMDAYVPEDKKKVQVTQESVQLEKDLRDTFMDLQKNGHCSELREALENSISFKLCTRQSFQENPLEQNPLAFSSNPGTHYFQGCNLANTDEVESALGRYYELLASCPEDQQKLRESSKKKLAEVVASRLKKMCSQAAEGTRFAMSLATPDFPYPPESQKLQTDYQFIPDERSDIERINTTLHFAQFYYLRDYKPDPLDTAKYYKNTNQHQEGDPNLTRAEEIRAKIENSCKTDLKLSDEDKEKLRKELSQAHQQYIENLVFKLDDQYHPYSNFLDNDKDYKDHVTVEVDKGLKELENKYATLKLDTKEEILSAYARLEFLLSQDFKSFGFYHCYSCEHSEAKQIDCDGMKSDFQYVARMGNEEDFKKFKNPEDFFAIVEKSLQNAEKETPPMCAGQIPTCVFDESGKCIKTH